MKSSLTQVANVRRRAGRRLSALGCITLGLLACGSGEPSVATIEPPLPANLEAFDLYLVERIQTYHDELLAAPTDPQAWVNLGMTYEANALGVLAIECYHQALALEETAKTWSRVAQAIKGQGRLEEAAEAMGRSIELDGTYGPSHWRLGNFLFDLGRFDEARAAFESASQVDPDHLGGATGLARVLLQESQPEEAIRVLEEVLERAPDDADTRRILRTAYIQAGRPAAQARASWRRVTSLGKDPWLREFKDFRERPLMERALVELQGGDPATAVTMLIQFAEENPEDLNVLSYLAWAHYRAGAADRARATVDQALEQDPDNIPALRVLSQIEEGTGGVEQAIPVLERILELDANDLDAAEKVGKLFLQVRRWKEAAKHFEALLALDRRRPEQWVLLGRCRIEQADWERAAEAFRTALEYKATGSEPAFGLARAYAELGRIEEACTVLEELAETSEEARRFLESLQDRSARADSSGGGGS